MKAETGVIPYLKCEYNQQIERMKALGINIEAQLFEQCVNSLLHMLETRSLPDIPIIELK